MNNPVKITVSIPDWFLISMIMLIAVNIIVKLIGFIQSFRTEKTNRKIIDIYYERKGEQK